MLAALVAGPAMAADMPVKARPLPPPPPVYNWTGCYVGVGVGYGMFNQDRDVISLGRFAAAGPNPPTAVAVTVAIDPLFSKETFGGRGWLGTAQFGCDYQFVGPFGGNWVIGAFIDGDWTNIRGDQSIFASFRGEAQLRSSWAVGGRIGWLVTPNLLTFFSAGYTQANFDEVNYVNGAQTALAVQLAPGTNFALAAFPGAIFQRESQRYSGFFLGGGTEYAIQWWPGLFWKTEYRFADYRSETTPLICITCTVAVGPGLAERVHPYVQTVRSELVWRFNWGKGPVRAAY